VSGGDTNTASGDYATVGGGYRNSASGNSATVAGGRTNQATNWAATVGGGASNTASGAYATVPGGIFNDAAGDFSFAAGRRAKANHNGAFVWADSQNADFASTRDNQFLIRAAGGVGIGTNDPQAYLDVASDASFTKPQVRIHSNTTDDFARLRFSSAVSSGDPKLWDIAAWGSDRTLRFYSFEANEDVMTLDAVDGVGVVGMGTTQPQARRLHVVGSSGQYADLQRPRDHVAVIENTSRGNANVLALKVGDTYVTTEEVFITFYSGSNTALGRIYGDGSGGVRFVSYGSDYAEWLPKAHPAEELKPGDIVGLFPDGVSKRTDGALRVLVVSDSAIVAGNMPANEDERERRALVAFVGQVWVRVRGPVRVGDYIVPSGKNDGTGIAVHPQDLTFAHLAQVVGRVWELGEEQGDGLRRVRVAVGLPGVVDVAGLLQAKEQRIQALEQRLAALETRLAALERRLNHPTAAETP